MTVLPQRAALLDSGLGGLSVLSALRTDAPQCDVVYFADTAHVPYGDRPLEEVASLGTQICDRLLSHRPSLIIVASGTTCAAFEELGWPSAPVPLLGVVAPGAAAALAATRNKRIGVVATQATIDSRVFEKALARLSPEVQAHSVAAPALVPLVESGRWKAPAARDAVEAVCRPLRRAQCDTVILGCTHFPHLHDWFEQALEDGTVIVDPGAACASKAAMMLSAMRPLSGRLDYEVSGDARAFERNAASLCAERASSSRHVRLDVLFKPSGIA